MTTRAARPDRTHPPRLADAELLTLAVTRALHAIRSEACRLRTEVPSLKQVIRLLAVGTDRGSASGPCADLGVPRRQARKVCRACEPRDRDHQHLGYQQQPVLHGSAGCGDGRARSDAGEKREAASPEQNHGNALTTRNHLLVTELP